MYKHDFYFDLPPALIAQYPLAKRSDSRLLVYNRQDGTHKHQQFSDLPSLLREGDLLVMNDTKVIPARFYGHKASGGKVEFLLERLLDDAHFLAHLKASKSPKPGTLIHLENGWQVQVIAKQENIYHCASLTGKVEDLLTAVGHIPLPPYINRADEHSDEQRYQTIYAKHRGSVAAPTAGLHFDEALMHNLKQKGVRFAYTTLHVGAGTFQPVKCESIYDHVMHSEQLTITAELAEAVNETRHQGNRVIAVGTTAMRSLESAAVAGQLIPCSKETSIFIYPGYQFQLCDGLITNFHVPESTLLMLVAAFIGHAKAMALYQEAIAQNYRFFSYGDANLLL